MENLTFREKEEEDWEDGDSMMEVTSNRAAPSIKEFQSYDVWKKAFRLWQSGTKLSKKKQALEIVCELSDNMTGYPKDLATMFCRSNAKRGTPDVEEVIKFLDEHLEVDQYDILFRLYRDFETCEISEGEKITDFTTRFEAKYRALLKQDPALKIPDKILAMKIMMAAKLNPAELMNVKSNVNWEEGDSFEATIKSINKLCSGDVAKGADSAGVKMTLRAQDFAEISGDVKTENCSSLKRNYSEISTDEEIEDFKLKKLEDEKTEDTVKNEPQAST